MSLHIHNKGVVFVQDVLFTAMIHFTTYMFTLQEIQASARQQQQFAVVLRLKQQFRKLKQHYGSFILCVCVHVNICVKVFFP